MMGFSEKLQMLTLSRRCYQNILYHTFGWYEPADKILDRGKGRDYVHKGAKGKGTCNI